MIARRIATVLPSFCRHEALEATRVHSVAGLLAEKDGPLLAQRPFRAPHHSCSVAGLVGGGTLPRPGEVSLAHNGVLFLDELPEFTRASLEALRQPLEDGHVTIVRAKHAVSFPARFMLVASMNPCPCGYAGSELRTCTCGEKEAYRYRSRLSGPLLDRFDVVVRVAAVAADAVLHSSPGEPSSAIARRVEQAREHQRQRYASPDSGKLAFRCNAQLDARGLKQHIALDSATKTLLTDYAELHQLSARAMVRACKVARTIADLGESTEVEVSHLAEALSLLGHHHFN
jgi:magnesium chelatase family protein